MGILSTSAALSEMPSVRKLALRESLRSATTSEAVVAIALENVSDSPFVPSHARNQLAELLFAGNFDAMRQALQCRSTTAAAAPSSAGRDYGFENFREMVVAIFSRSRKVALLPAERRRALGAAIHATSSKDELKALALHSLETSQAFQGAEREMVANDIMDDRYDLLLRPDRFDCEERRRPPVAVVPRSNSNVGRLSSAQLEEERAQAQVVEVADECPVCLGDNNVDRALPCGHGLCRSCATAWLNRCATCPLCRAGATLSQCRPVTRAKKTFAM